MRACEEGSADKGLLAALDWVEFSSLFCEVEVCGGEGGDETEVEEGFLNESGAWSVDGDFDVGGCGCGVSVGLPSLVVLVPNKTYR